jgi:serine protease inhibitor
VLHFTLGGPRMHNAFSSFSDALNSGGTVDGNVLYQLSVANALWGQSGYPYNSDFLQLLSSDYGADLHQADFIHDAGDACSDINQWVALKTNDKIKDLLPPHVLDPTPRAVTRLVLVNAIYFKGNWDGPFDPSLTQDQPFHLDDQHSVNVPLMHKSGKMMGFDSDDMQALVTYYVGKRLEMVVLLPKTTTGLAALESKLTPDNLTTWVARAQDRQVDFFLPKFKLESQFELNDALASMGMPNAFDARTADFSGISSEPGLFLSHVIHKAYVDVNEEGTEAAAATAVGVAVPGCIIAPPPPMTFRADHPFVFLIRDQATGAILFLGRVTDPRQ